MPFPAVHPALDEALAQRGYDEPTPVQAAVLEQSQSGGLSAADLLVSAQTGSGKTVAFGLAAAPTLLPGGEPFGRADIPLMLAIAPTRELALQVAAELTWLYAGTSARLATCVGGMDARAEARKLNAGAHIVVGTPGRLKDHIDRGNLDLSALKVVVLDEADEMLDMGFREDLEFILDQAPAERRTLLFSATIAREIAALAKRYQKDAVRIDTTDRTRAHADIEYRAMRIAPNEIEKAVVNVLRFFEAPGALVFCSTRESVKHLQAALRERGFASVGLSGELSQRERTDALQALRDGQARVCVATDVAARGLDLPDLGLVIHAELPVNRATLLHRSGRTGRAGRKGVSVLLVPNPKRRRAEMLLGSAGVEATWDAAPTADAIRARDDERLMAAGVFDAEVSDEDMALARKLVKERTPDELAAALVALLRAKMPAPEELADPGERPRKERGEAATAWPSERLQPHEVSWWRASVGRQQNADPKWLIPLICRLGGVTKRDIGSIRVLPDETRFEISLEAEAKFREALSGAAPGEAVKITPSSAPEGSWKTKSAFAPRRPAEDGERRPDFKHRPHAGAHAGPRPPYAGKNKGKPFAKAAGKPGKPAFKKSKPPRQAG
jgi:ATP-dependent RNA helicase DeaD